MAFVAPGKRGPCVFLVGYSSGFVRGFIKDDGRLCLSQRFMARPVVRLRLQPAAAPDIVVLYGVGMVVVDGVSVLALLRSGEGALQYRQWALDGQSRCCDIAACGLEVPNAYAQMLSPENEREPHNRYIAVGENAMISVYTTLGCDRPAFSAAALASTVATRLSTAVVSVVTSLWGKRRDARRESNLVTAAPASTLPALPTLFGLQDSRRRVVTISRGPQGLCAATDTFGRVLLMDSATATIVRVWKGYRDAQVCWLWAGLGDTTPDRNADHTRRPWDAAPRLLLAIHAPRRELVELWALRSGARVAAGTVPPGDLLDGGSSGGAVDPRPTTRAVFLCHDGRLLEIQPPPAAALRDMPGAVSRERGLLQLLDEKLVAGSEPAAVLEPLRELRTASSLRQALTRLSQPTTPSAVLGACLPALQLQATRLPPSEEASECARCCSWAVHALETHNNLAALEASWPPSATPDVVSLQSMVHLSDSTRQRLTDLLGRTLALEAAASHPPPAASASVGTLLSALSPGSDGAGLNPSLPDADLTALARLVFGSLPTPLRPRATLEDGLRRSGIAPASLMRLLLRFVLDQPCAVLLQPAFLESLPDTVQLLQSLDSRGPSLSALAYAECLSSANVPAALVLSLVASHSSFAHTDWTILTRRLESLCALHCLQLALAQPPRVLTVARVLAAASFEETVADIALASGLTADMLLGKAELSSAANAALAHLKTVCEEEVVAPVPGASPYSFTDAVAVWCAWLASAHWVQSLEGEAGARSSLTQLASIESYLSATNSPRLRYGLGLGLWGVVLRARVCEAVALVEKVGKCPKERLCLKHVGMAAPAVAALCGLAARIMNTLAGSAEGNTPTIGCAAWASRVDRTLDATGDARLHGLEQHLGPTVVPALAAAHATLCHVAQLTYALGLRLVHPLQLFAQPLRQRFFSPLGELGEPLAADDGDADGLATARQLFVTSALAAAVQESRDLVPLVLTVASGFAVPQAGLSVQHICNLCERGEAVSDLLLAVPDPARLGPLLLDIARRRIAAHLAARPLQAAMALSAHMTVTLTDWLQAVPTPGPAQCEVAPVGLDSTVLLLKHCGRLLTPNSDAAELCAQLLAAVESMVRMQ